MIGADIYNGAARIDLYEGATYTGGSAVTCYNRERNFSAAPATVIKSGITSTNGTLIESFYTGAWSRQADANRSGSEFILKSGTTYRVDVTGLSAGTDAIVFFSFYEDLGV